ncbi:aldehyde dehydrogenase family protein [Alteromonas antoniana]|uniref:aldehyde dehydrogenase family protein n=1 Tax=Alteromonas antoniana TaxID=2803813 RepID=UPI001C447C34|nr:aldehyde dehydrogenase family protein [Alteromonas antoniana]
MKTDSKQFYIQGQWCEPRTTRTQALVNPATAEPYGAVALGSVDDVDSAVSAAKAAFASWSQTSVEQRLDILKAIRTLYKARYSDLVAAITLEMGAPVSLSTDLQAAMGIAHIDAFTKTLSKFAFEHQQGTTCVRKEPIGVVGLITPWNWPVNQIMCKVIPALAAGCTMVLKPSEMSPLSADLIAQILHEAGVPAGVFNLVHGDGATVGNALSSHPDIDMMSFTGSTRAGTAVSKTAADTVKRVSLELGGKSANILLDDADFAKAVKAGVQSVFSNSGQTCTAPTRMLVPASRLEEVNDIARAVAEKALQGVGDPNEQTTRIGPLANQRQFDKVRAMIDAGIAEGATLLAGGSDFPSHLSQGFFVKPTIFTDVSNDMTIAQEEIFGPVLCIMPYTDEDDAVRIANDSPYGLSGYVSGSPERARQVARRMRTGMVHINGAHPDLTAPFGGYKQSGNGREWGEYGLDDFMETKSIPGFYDAP